MCNSLTRLIIGVLFLCSPFWATADVFLTAEDLGNWKWSGFNLYTANLNESDFRDLALSGARVGRIHLEVKRCETCSHYAPSIQDATRLDRSIALASKFGLKIIIVLDPTPKGKEADFWSNYTYRSSLINIWKSLAEKYRTNSNVAGYDLINEPHPPDAISWDGGSDMWTAFALELIEHIRRIDPNHPIIFEAAPIALPGAFKNLRPLPNSNVVYSFHFYEPHQLTHQGILGFPEGLPYPGEVPRRGYWDKARLASYFSAVDTFQRKYKVPVQVGEFGFIRFGTTGSRARYIKDVLDLVKERQWSWLFHSFREWDGWDSEVQEGSRLTAKRPTTSTDYLLLKNYLAN